MQNKLFRTFSLAYLFIFLVSYAFLPYVFFYDRYPQFVTLLIQITLVSVFSFLIGLNISFGKRIKLPVYVYSFNKAIRIIFFIFISVVIIILITAPKIPIIESFKGASSENLSIYREEFLKDRKGWEVSLNYLISIISAFFLPYFIALAFLRNHKYKFLYTGIFLLYCISFIEKAYFFKIALPIFFVYLYQTKNKRVLIIKGFTIILAFLVVMYIFEGTTYDGVTQSNFFSIKYRPTGISENIIWRSLIVPIATALDGLRVFITAFRGQFFYGNTSSFIAFFNGRERINFERYLYQTQFGGTETGNANQFYMIEAYINFGYVGVVIFSLVVGRIIRSAIKLNDVALLSIIPLFIFNLFNAGFIGILLSNGFLLFFIIIKLIRFK